MASVSGLEEAVARFMCSGWGSGSGSGSGGITLFCGENINVIDGIPTIIHSVHGNVAGGAILRDDLTLQKCYVVKANGYFAHGETIREAQMALQAKIMEDTPIEERIERFAAEFEPGRKYPAMRYYEWHHILTGSCEMGRKEFAEARGIDLARDEFTPEEFMDLTKDAYGGEIIEQLIEAYKKVDNNDELSDLRQTPVRRELPRQSGTRVLRGRRIRGLAAAINICVDRISGRLRGRHGLER